MLGWIVFGLIGVAVLGLSAAIARRWGRGAHSGMSEKMESESANYLNYSRGPFVS